MRRAFALLLALALAVSLTVPVLAAGDEPEEGQEPQIDLGMLEPGEGTVSFPVPEQEQTMDADLSALTLKVKQTLDIDDDYTDFSSDYYDGPSPLWSLGWSDETRQLTVEARPDGTVVNMYRWENGGVNERFYGFDPAFPAITMDQATAQAESWCEKLFTGEESARLDETRVYLGTEGYYRVSGTVLKNGLDSPITFDMVIDGSGLTSFYRRDQNGYVGELPEAVKGDEAGAEASLAGAVQLELRWVSDGEGGARLQYVPVGPRTVADPVTGEAVDMDALYESLDEKGMNYAYDTMAAEAPMAEEAMADGGVSLTETEIASIENYGDVLDGAAIDKALQANEALGLEGFEQARCSYAMDAESGDVTASVRYTGTMTDERLYGYSQEAFEQAVKDGQDMTIYKYFTLDAKTGAIKSLSTSYPIWEKQEGMLGLVDQAGFAEQFIADTVPELAAEVAGCTLKGYDEGEELTFARMYEGYFYPDDRIEIHVDPTSGVVDQFWYTWDEDVAFGPSEDVIDADEALAAYTDALELTLGYVAWPIDVTKEPDGPYADWLRWGTTYVEELHLAYYFAGTDKVEGVDAVTAEAVLDRQLEDAYTYDDLDGVENGDKIELLGLAGVGFSGGSFLPDQELTGRDAAVLLLRAGGNYAPEDDDERLAEQAYHQGLVPDGQFEPQAAVTRIEYLRMLLTPSRYGYAAALTGVWDAGFSDVDEADQAIAAIARALGLADGKKLEPDETLTRADAAALLARFMER